MTILHYAFVAFEVVLIFNLIIGVHELGHFLAARWRGMKVERFAIWFGKPIWKQKIGGVEYVLGSIPFGGYVSLPQMATMEAIEGKADNAEPLPNASPLDKIIVAFAGPLFSFGLAIIFAVIVWQVGRPVAKEGDNTKLGWVDENGPAWQAGLRPGDIITAVDGYPVKNFVPTENFADSVKWRIVTSTGPSIQVDYTRDGKAMPPAYVVPTNVPTKWYERKSLRQIFCQYAEKSVIDDLASNGPAARAGLLPGDEITALNGQPVYSPLAIVSFENTITNKPDNTATFTILRGSEQLQKTVAAVKPVSPSDAGPSFGINSWQGDTNIAIVHPAPWDQIQSSAGQIFSTLAALFEPKGQIGVQQLGGAVMIIRVYSTLFGDEFGWRRVLWFSVILNVNLALLNLLPLPVLDGGHIVLSLIEAIRRRPVHATVLSYLQNGFAVLLIAFMLYIAFFDTGDWIRSAHRDAPIVFAAPK